MKKIFSYIFVLVFGNLNAGNIIIYQVNEDDPYSGTTTVTWNNGANSMTLNSSQEVTIIDVDGILEISSSGAAAGDLLGMEFEETGAFVFNFETPSDGVVYNAALPATFDTCSDIEGIPCDADGDQSTTGDEFDNLCNCQFVLPVELITFQASKTSAGALIKWSTASEVNNQGFSIEKSKTGTTGWREIAFSQGNGTVFERVDYSHLDTENLQGKNYYRLRQIDFDGENELSPSIMIEFEINETTFRLMPNPANDFVTLRFNKPMSGQLSVYDIAGKLIRQKYTVEAHQLTEDVSDLSAGAYFITFESNDRQIFNEKLIKQ